MNMNNINKIYNSYKNNIINNNNTNNSNIIINISGTKLKKDENDKPFIEYLIEVKKNNEIWRLHKKFIQFAILNKNLKNIIKEKIPQSENIFNNIINDQKVFHENKISQLDKYIKDLLNINEIEKIEPFKNFFELDENKHNKSKTNSNNSSNNNTFINNDKNFVKKNSQRKNINMNIKKNINKK